MDITKLGAMQELLRAEQVEMDTISDLLDKHLATQKRIARIKAAIDQNAADIEQLWATHRAIDAECQTAPHKIADNEGYYARVQAEEQALVTKMADQLQALGEALPHPRTEEELTERLNQRRQEYESVLTTRKTLTDELNVLTNKLEEGQVQIDAYKERLESLNAQRHTEEVVSLHLAKTEKRKANHRQGSADLSQQERFGSLVGSRKP